mgnify:CR=1 FL=1
MAETTTFTNRGGVELAARIDLPPDDAPRAFVLLAHCFTCSKDLTAHRRIARSLTGVGLGVMSFDFTGLGASGGDFADTTFSSQASDLVDAAEHPFVVQPVATGVGVHLTVRHQADPRSGHPERETESVLGEIEADRAGPEGLANVEGHRRVLTYPKMREPIAAVVQSVAVRARPIDSAIRTIDTTTPVAKAPSMPAAVKPSPATTGPSV